MERRQSPGLRNVAACVAVVVATTIVLTGCRPKTKERPLPPATGSEWAQIDAKAPMANGAPGEDRDGDSVTDDRERDLGSNPESADSDGDGFPDGLEDRFADYGFDLVRETVDRDRDGLPDDREAELGTNPSSPDSDGDGWSDFDEELNRYFGFDPTKRTKDADFDGLADDLELRIGSSPSKVDSNEDGIPDFPTYAADFAPGGPKLIGGRGELIGITYSPAMAEALEAIRRRRSFPAELAPQLPYPEVTAELIRSGAARPSAALMQRSVYNPHNSPGLYPTYAEIERDLFALANTYDGNPGPAIVRLFHWTGQTVDNCDPRGHRRGGRRIYALKISGRPDRNTRAPEVLFMGLHHARELITATHTLRLLHKLTDEYATDPGIREIVDSREIWVIPVVNPNGYERAIGSQVDWRKNTRLVANQTRCGIDLNRNYGFEHVTAFPPAQRAALPDVASSGVSSSGSLVPDSQTFPGPQPFSEVETQAVRGLAHSQFLTRLRREVDGLGCALSWHSYGGVVGHPMSHVPQLTTGLQPADVVPFGDLTAAMANEAGYTDVRDGFPTLTTVDGCGYGGYSVYGDSDDWLYKDGGTFAVLIEAYSRDERGTCATGPINYDFYPLDAPTRDLVAEHNVRAALAMLRRCPEAR